MQINRLFEIIYVLMNKKTTTARELAKHFDVSMRTIYRDIDALSFAGIPIYTEKGRGGGISLMPDFVLNKFILNEQEQGEVLSALQSISNINAINSSETNKVLQKLSVVFNKNTVNWMEVDFSDWSFENGDVFYDFKTAILEQRVAEFDYYSTYGEKTFRRIEPIQLWFKSRAWYIKGFCLTRNNIRLFKLTRIENLTVTDALFPERNLLEHDSDSIASPYSKPLVNLKLKIAPEMSHRVYDEFSRDMIKKQADGSFLVSTTWMKDDWIYGTILSFGEHIEVLEPEYIREIVKCKAQNIVKKYL